MKFLVGLLPFFMSAVAFSQLENSTIAVNHLSIAEGLQPNFLLVKIDQAGRKLSLFQPSEIRLEAGDVVQIVSNDRQVFEITVSRVQLTPLGSWAASGTTKSGGTFILVVSREGDWVGSLEEDHQYFSISSSGGVPSLRKRSASSTPRLSDEPKGFEPPVSSVNIKVEPGRQRSLPIATATAKASDSSDHIVFPHYNANPVIDVLFYYDSDMSSPIGVIDYYVENANYHFDNTDMSVTVRAVKALPLAINNNWTNSDVYDRMKERTSPYVDLDTERGRYKADLVYTVRATESRPENICGTARYSVYKGRGYRDNIVGVADWDPDDNGGGSYCYTNIF